ncbi:246_t:CDS:1, partial [Funneliformis mosseae]
LFSPIAHKNITLYGNNNFTILRNMLTCQSTEFMQDLVTTSFTSTSNDFETDELKRYFKYWWKTGKIHLKAKWK